MYAVRLQEVRGDASLQKGLQVFATWLLLEMQQVRTLSCQLLGFGRVIVVLLAASVALRLDDSNLSAFLVTHASFLCRSLQ